MAGMVGSTPTHGFPERDKVSSDPVWCCPVRRGGVRLGMVGSGMEVSRIEKWVQIPRAMSRKGCGKLWQVVVRHVKVSSGTTNETRFDLVRLGLDRQVLVRSGEVMK